MPRDHRDDLVRIREMLEDLEERIASLEASGPGYDADDDEDLVDDDDLEGEDGRIDMGLGKGLDADDPRMGPRRDERTRAINRFRRAYDQMYERDCIF
jgi:hypothetical protein